jgi:peptidoglycan/xylan/chitin deacetylase (PgdA/CDA1 family)
MQFHQESSNCRPVISMLPLKVLRGLGKILRLPIESLFGVITHIKTRQPLVALTFDDGPSPEWTPQLLEILDRHNAKATFFIVGEMAQCHPELVEQIARAGHCIGNHSWNHPSFPLINLREKCSQIKKFEQTIKTHNHARLFRPPYGDLDWTTRILLLWLGYKVITWNVVAGDWEDQSAECILKNLSKYTKPGSIVLLHDQLFTYSDYSYTSRDVVFKALDTFLLTKKNKIKFLTIPELLNHGNPQKEVWLKRSEPELLNNLSSISNLGFDLSQIS